MKPRRPKKLKAGSTPRWMDKIATISRQMERERQRHSNKRMSIAVQRDALAGIADLALRTAMLAKLRYGEVEEYQRHKSRVAELERRLRDARR